MIEDENRTGSTLERLDLNAKTFDKHDEQA